MDVLESTLPTNSSSKDTRTSSGSISDASALTGFVSGSLLDHSSGSAENDDVDDSEQTRCHTEVMMDTGDASSQECSVEEMDENELLAMIENGEVGYEVEEVVESEPMEADEGPIEFAVETSLPPTLANDVSVSSPDASRKRCAEHEVPTDSEAPQDKKPKYTESDSFASPTFEMPLSDSSPSMASISIDDSSIMDGNLPEKSIEPAPTKTQVSPPNKTPSRTRGSSVVITTPLSVVTRRGAMSAATSGAEMIVPEHSHTVPRFMPRVPIRAIEIPVWSIRDTYEEEEDLIAQYQRLSHSKNAPKSAETSAALHSLESKYLSLAGGTTTPSTSAPSNSTSCTHSTVPNGTDTICKSTAHTKPSALEDMDTEIVGDDDYYAVRHYKLEIAERLRWLSGPGSDRFKKEDRNMTVNQFRRHPLASTYIDGTSGRLLPEEKWAQNMVHERPRSTRRDRSASRCTPTKSPSKLQTHQLPTPVDGQPRKFIFKIKTTTSTKIITASFPPNANVPLKSNLIPSKKTPSRTSPTHPVVKKSGISQQLPHHQAPPPPAQRASPHSAPATLPFVAPVSVPTPPPPPPPKLLPSRPPTKLVVKFGSKTFGSNTTSQPSALPSTTSSLPPLLTATISNPP